jgi:hypothetical protein
MYPDVVGDLRGVDPVSAAATFGGLLAVPDLQANCLRLEVLVHLAMSYGVGKGPLSREIAQTSFDGLGRDLIGMMEDPAEDVFATLVHAPAGNYRILEGISEGAGFHLQRMLNIVERMPHEPECEQMRSSITSLLRLSDTVLIRAGICEYSLGDELPHKAIPTDLLNSLQNCGEFVQFTKSDLTALGITPASLREFTFDFEAAPALKGNTIFHTGLERRPLVWCRETAYLVLPTAIGSAIIRFVAESILATGQLGTLEWAIADEYRRLFQESPLLGQGPNAPIHFQRIEGGRIAAALAEVDPGRYLQLVFIASGLAGFVERGFNSINPADESLARTLYFHLGTAAAHAAQRPGFRSGITLAVGCGIGRSMGFNYSEDVPEGWSLEVISAYDLCTLSWVHNFDALSLFRLDGSKRALEAEGTALFNPNGLLNLVAWSRKLEGHLVPHSSLPAEFALSDGNNLIAIEQNAIRALRHEVLKNWDPRRVLDIDNVWKFVQKSEPTLFAEDNRAPLFVSADHLKEGRLRSVYTARNRPYWVEINAPADAPRSAEYEHWTMLNTWLARAAPVIDEELTSLPSGPVAFMIHFAELLGDTPGMRAVRDEPDLRALMHVVRVGLSEVRIELSAGFGEGYQRAENIAERLIVEAMVSGAAAMCAEPISENLVQKLVGRICPNTQARYLHRFQARAYRDFIRERGARQPLLIDDVDGGTCKLGLAWRVLARGSVTEVSGITECTAFLNAVVTTILDDICGTLKQLDRRRFVDAVLRNHEAVECDRDRWRRTASANLALHTDRNAALATIVEREGRLNACAIASRILLEAAICECPLEGGRDSGKLDLTRLMTQIMIAFHWGGYSDAIHWGGTEPRLRITPLGDIHFDQTFIDTIYKPFGRIASERDVHDAVEKYPARFAPNEIPPAVASVLEGEFLSAWEAEFGISVDGMRDFLDHLEEACFQHVDSTIVMPRAEVVRMMGDAIRRPEAFASSVLEQFTLTPRKAWRVVDPGFTNRDWYPWRFRRRLSVLRRPFLQLGDGESPDLTFAPGLVREAFALTVMTLDGGEIPDAQMRSRQMRSWLGGRNHRQRLEFNTAVAERMRELGWEVLREVKPTALTRARLDHNYGDVDVVAWRPGSGRVLLMECKDVQYHKTLGEVAEQLRDFRGELLPNGSPDLLRKHLDRIEVLQGYPTEIAKTLKLRAPICLEGHIVFKNPVPMRFISDRLADRIKLSLFDELDRL